MTINNNNHDNSTMETMIINNEDNGRNNGDKERYPNDIRGNGHRRTGSDARPLAKAKQHAETRKKERHDKRAALDVYTKILIVLLWVI